MRQLLCARSAFAYPAAVVLALVALPVFARGAGDAPPRVDEQAQAFELSSLSGTKVALADALRRGPVVLVVLRGYPGYQCPICTRQVGDLIAHAEEFAAADAQVLLVYPGPAADLQSRAEEFLAETTLPEDFHVLLDPDYSFTKQYHLRWDAPRETAYPSTFVIDRQGVVRYALVSKSHGGRAATSDVLAALED